jgi:hypothetical protein
MGRLTHTPGQGLAARLALFKADGEDGAIINPAAYDGDIEVFGAVRVFRKEGDRVFAAWKIAAATINAVRYVLAVVYTPGSARDAQAPFTALVTDLGADLVKSWPVVLTNGVLLVPALDADATQVGVGVKANWPATWKVYMPGDTPGTPTGARCIAQVIA